MRACGVAGANEGEGGRCGGAVETEYRRDRKDTDAQRQRGAHRRRLGGVINCTRSMGGLISWFP